MAVFLFILLSLTPQILDVIMPLNETRQKKMMFYLEYNIDHEKYFYWTVLHAVCSSVCLAYVIFCADTIFLITVHHACGIFAIIR